MKLPPEMLQQHLKDMLEGLLLWGDDPKNKFRLKVRPPPIHKLTQV